MNLSTEKKTVDLENRLVISKREWVGLACIGSLGLIDPNYCLWKGLAMRSCCVALGTMSSHLWWSIIMWEKRMYICMCKWVTMLYSRKKIMHWGNKKKINNKNAFHCQIKKTEAIHQHINFLSSWTLCHCLHSERWLKLSKKEL